MKIVKNILVIIVIIICFSTHTFAYNVEKELGSSDLSNYANVQNLSTASSFNSKVGVVLGVIATAGSIIAIIALVGIGIKYMSGSVQEKAEYKKTLKPYLIGAIMIFGISNLLNPIYKIVTNLFLE